MLARSVRVGLSSRRVLTRGFASSSSTRGVRSALLARSSSLTAASLSSRAVSRGASMSVLGSVSRASLSSVQQVRLMSAAAAAAGDLPTHQVLNMPALSPTMEAGTITAWQVKEGDEIMAGDVLADVETDKATVAFESTEDGYVAKILVPEGTADVPIGQPVLVTVEEEEDVAAFKDYEAGDGAAPAAAPKQEEAAPAPKQEAAPAAAEPAAAEPSAPAQAAPAQQSGGRVIASPYARLLAREQGVNLNSLQGTGPGGRIIAADVSEFDGSSAAPAQQAAPATASVAAAGPYEDEPLTNMRKVIAKRLLESKTTIPHYYLTVECSMDNLLEIRKELNESIAPEKVSVNDFIIKASALALRKVPEVNSSWMDTAIRRYNYVDISVAVSTDAGLVTPIVADADLKGLARISSDVRDLAGRARENKLAPEEFQGGTFTISNLGMFGVDNFSAIINPPQACILAVGAASRKVVPNDGPDAEEQPYKTGTFMNVTMSCDHRVVDGAVGAQWLGAFRGYIENPKTMLL